MAALALQAQLSAASAAPVGGRDPVHDFIATFSGKHHYILDYLAEEVFNHQPAHIQAFLLQTSILERMCAPLCAALTGPGDGSSAGQAKGVEASRPILDYLERSNLFLVPLDGEQQWYRYHHLFADLLRARLRQVWPSRVADLHVRASAWYAHNGWNGEAIRHALAGQDWERAARLVEQNVQEFIERGRLAQVMDWVDALPPQVAHNRPRLCVELSWALPFASQVQQAAPFLRDAEAALDAWQAAPRAGRWRSPAGAGRWRSPAGRGTLAQPRWRDAGAAPLAGDRLDQAEVSRCAPSIAVMKTFGAIMSGDRAGALAQAQAALVAVPAGPSRELAFLNWVAGFASRSLGICSWPIITYPRRRGSLPSGAISWTPW